MCRGVTPNPNPQQAAGAESLMGPRPKNYVCQMCHVSLHASEVLEHKCRDSQPTVLLRAHRSDDSVLLTFALRKCWLSWRWCESSGNYHITTRRELRAAMKRSRS